MENAEIHASVAKKSEPFIGFSDGFISEIFPNRIRAMGQSFGSSIHWVFAALITLFGPSVIEIFNTNPWPIFAFFAFFAFRQNVLLFSCLGVDTLCELKQAFLTVGQEVPLYSQPDMHDVGDALLAARYVDPVMHRDVITLHYRTLDQLFYDLRVMGATYFDAQRTKTCLGKNKWKQVLSYYDELRDDQRRYPVTIEILYGQAIAPDLAYRSTSNGNEVTVSVDDIIKPLS